MRLRPRGGFDAPATLRGGQAFLWTVGDDAFHGVALGRAWRLRVDGPTLDVDVDLAAAAVARYLGLAPDYPRALARLARDPALAPAIAAHRGLRILRQDPWEALAAFIVSANNNVPRIEGILRRVAARWGAPVAAPPGGEGTVSGRPAGWTTGSPDRPGRARKPVEGPDRSTRSSDPPRASTAPRAFPPPAALARADLGDLRACGLGYRAPYLRDAARAVAEGFPLAGLARRPYAAAREALVELPGVGPKVADCVALFGLGHGEAFPVDTWVRHAMAGILGEDLPLGEVAGAARARWGADAGLAQQFLFHAARVAGKGGRRAPGLPC